MLRQTNRIDNSSERLKNIQSMALENERIGGDILNTLRGQRETIQRTKETVRMGCSTVIYCVGQILK